MAFGAWPDDIATTIYVDTEIDISTITTTEDFQQLRYFGVQVFKYGLNSGVDMYVKAYLSGTEIAISERIQVSDIPTDTDYFYGWFYFRFTKRVNLSATGIQFKLFLDNYTFSESSWIGLIYDWPTQMGYNDYSDQVQGSPFAIDLLGDII